MEDILGQPRGGRHGPHYEKIHRHLPSYYEIKEEKSSDHYSAGRPISLIISTEEKSVIHDDENPIYFQDSDDPPGTLVYDHKTKETVRLHSDKNQNEHGYDRHHQTYIAQHDLKKIYDALQLYDDQKQEYEHAYDKKPGHADKIVISHSDHEDFTSKFGYDSVDTIIKYEGSSPKYPDSYYSVHNGHEHRKKHNKGDKNHNKQRVHVYDQHLHSYPNHEASIDFIISPPKQKITKLHRYKETEYHEENKSSDDQYAYRRKFPTRPSKYPSKASKPLADSEAAADSSQPIVSVPNLSPTDVMSSLFLQSLLVRALDQTLLSSSTTTPTAAATSDSSKPGTTAAPNDMTAYRFRKMFNGARKKSNETRVDEDVALLQVSQLDKALGEIKQGMSANDIQSKESEIMESHSQSEQLMQALIQRLMNSTLVISNDAVLMLMNNQSRSHFNPPSRNFMPGISESSNTAAPPNAIALSTLPPVISTSSTVSTFSTPSSTSFTQSTTVLELSSNTMSDFVTERIRPHVRLNELTTVGSGSVINLTEEERRFNILRQNNSSLSPSENKRINNEILGNLAIHVHVHTPAPSLHVLSPKPTSSKYRLKPTKLPSQRVKLVPRERYVSTIPYNHPRPTHAHLRHKPRITFYPPSSTPKYAEFTQPSVQFATTTSEPPLHLPIKHSVPSHKTRGEQTGFRVKLQDSSTKSPIEYEIILSQTPPIVDGEVIPTPKPDNIESFPTNKHIPVHSSSTQTVTHSPVVLDTTNSFLPSSVEASPITLTPLESKYEAAYRTLKPIEYLLRNNPTYFPPLLPEDLSPQYGASTLRIGSPASTMAPYTLRRRHEHMKSPLLSYLADTSKVAYPPGVSYRYPKAYVIPREHHHIRPNIRVLSAFNSLPDMFGDSYSIPLPLQPHSQLGSLYSKFAHNLDNTLYGAN